MEAARKLPYAASHRNGAGGQQLVRQPGAAATAMYGRSTPQRQMVQSGQGIGARCLSEPHSHMVAGTASHQHTPWFMSLDTRRRRAFVMTQHGGDG